MPLLDDEARVFEHAQMLHDTEPRHLRALTRARSRATVPAEELIEQEAASGIRERLEHAIIVGHVSMIGDQIVT